MRKWLTDENGNKYIPIRNGNEKLYRPKLKWFTERTYNKTFPWFARTPLLHLLVQWLITYSVIYPKLFSNDGKFKPGDKTVFNWKARVQIYSVINHKIRVETVSQVCYLDLSGLDFESGNHCAAFWMRKAYFWEK